MFRLEMKKVSMRSTVIFVLPFLYRLKTTTNGMTTVFKRTIDLIWVGIRILLKGQNNKTRD
jgi:hypothetical protein